MDITIVIPQIQSVHLVIRENRLRLTHIQILIQWSDYEPDLTVWVRRNAAIRVLDIGKVLSAMLHCALHNMQVRPGSSALRTNNTIGFKSVF